MKILSRVAMTLMLLGGLAYGSYAFGRYVLSTRLFGTSVTPASGSGLAVVPPGRERSSRVAAATTRRTELRGGKPHVEVSVLPADDAGPGPEPPSIPNLARATGEKGKAFTPSRSLRERVVTADSLRASAGRYGRGSELGDGERTGDEDRPRRRRRRRRDRAYTATLDGQGTARSTSDASAGSEATGVPREQLTEGISEDFSAETPRVSSSGSSSSSPDPIASSSASPVETDSERSSSRSGSSSGSGERRRRRSRSRRSESGQRSERRERPESRERSQSSRRSESPVPRPEGSSGGGSPIPQPE